MLKLSIVTPSTIFFQGDADLVVLPGVEGELGILPKHISLLTNLKSGLLKIKQSNEQKDIFVHTGLAEVKDDVIQVLTQDACFKDDLNLSAIQAKIKESKAQINELSDNEEKNRVQLDNLKYELALLEDQEAILK